MYFMKTINNHVDELLVQLFCSSLSTKSTECPVSALWFFCTESLPDRLGKGSSLAGTPSCMVVPVPTQGFIQKGGGGGSPGIFPPKHRISPPPQTPEEIFVINSDFNLVLCWRCKPFLKVSKERHSTIAAHPALPPVSPLSGKSCMNPCYLPCCAFSTLKSASYVEEHNHHTYYMLHLTFILSLHLAYTSHSYLAYTSHMYTS